MPLDKCRGGANEGSIGHGMCAHRAYGERALPMPLGERNIVSVLTDTIAHRWFHRHLTVMHRSITRDTTPLTDEAPDTGVAVASLSPIEGGDTPSMRHLPRSGWITLGLITLLAVSTFVRCYRLGYYSLWLDETTTYIVAAKPYGEILDQVYANHIFFHYALFHWFISLHLDGSAWLLRFPSMVAGVGSVWAVWDIGRNLFGEAEGWIAGILAALWPTLIIYSQEYREYSLFVLFCTASCAFLLHGLRTGHLGWWIVCGLTVVLNLDNTFLALLNAIGLAIFAVIWLAGDAWLGLRRTHSVRGMWRAVREPFWGGVSAAAIVAVGFLPGSLMLARLLYKPSFDLGQGRLVLNGRDLRIIFGTMLGLGAGWRLALIASLAVIGLVWLCVRRPRAAALALLWMALPLAFMAHSNSGAEFLFSPRYPIFLIPMYLLLIATGAVTIARGIAWALARLTDRVARVPADAARRLRWVVGTHAQGRVANILVGCLLVGLVASSLPATYGSNPKQIPMDLEHAYGYMLSRVQPGDVLLEANVGVGYAELWFTYYDSYFLRPAVRPANVIITTVNKETFPAALPGVLPARGRLWALVTLRPHDYATLQRAAGNDFDVHCYQQICALRSNDPGGPNLRPQLQRFLNLVFLWRADLRDPITKALG